MKINLLKITTALLLLLTTTIVYSGEVLTTNFAKQGLDDNRELQSALMYCSATNSTCVIPAGKKYKITTDLFMWSGASLVGGGVGSEIIFNPTDGPRALFQIGIAPIEHTGIPNFRIPENINTTTPYKKVNPSYNGRISNLTLTIDPSLTREYLSEAARAKPDIDAVRKYFRPSRLIYVWLADGFEISNNTINLNNAGYAATGSGVNANYVYGQLVHKNIRIVGNNIKSLDYLWSIRTKSGDGNEGIGLDAWDGAYIAHNTVTGVGDDMIGLHQVKNAVIEQNYLEGIDGAIYLGNTNCVAVLYNDIERKYYPGIDAGDNLINVERYLDNKGPPTQNLIYGNHITIYPNVREGASAIRLMSPRSTEISRNYIYDKRQYAPGQGYTGLTVQSMWAMMPVDFTSAYSSIGPYNGCFGDPSRKLALPRDLNFIPVVGDNYGTLLVGRNDLPVRNVRINDNIFAFSGYHNSLPISFTTVGNTGNFTGNVSTEASCNKSIMVGTNRCHSLEISNNRVLSVPWETCWGTGYSNKPDTGMVPLEDCNNHKSGMHVADVERTKAALINAEIFYYGPNTTNTKPTQQDPMPVPGRINAIDLRLALDITHRDTGNSEECPVSGIDARRTSDISGFCEIRSDAGEWLNYKINAMEAGQYNITLRVSSETTESKISLVINNTISFKDLTVLGTAVPSYVDVKIPNNVTLPKGVADIKLYIDSGKININYLKFEIYRSYP